MGQGDADPGAMPVLKLLVHVDSFQRMARLKPGSSTRPGGSAPVTTGYTVIQW